LTGGVFGIVCNNSVLWLRIFHVLVPPYSYLPNTDLILLFWEADHYQDRSLGSDLGVVEIVMDSFKSIDACDQKTGIPQIPDSKVVSIE